MAIEAKQPSGTAPAAWTLAIAALAAAAFHQLMLLLPLALMLFVPALMFGNTFLLMMALVAFALLAWVIQPNTTVAGRPLTRAEAPVLFARVDALSDALQAPRVHQIVLNDELNAGALELNRGVSIRPTRRVLLLGLPLLRLLDSAAAEAVIAHELGHFSRRHGRLGHWVYRTREAWADWASGVEHDEDSNAWERAGQAFAELFLPWFRRISNAHSRRCEFEADALAAQVVSPAALARALLIVELAGARASLHGPQALQAAMRRSAEPTQDWVEEPARWLRESPASHQELQDALSHRQPRGSHPPHRQRLAALGQDGAGLGLVPVAFDDSAAAQWLAEAWPSLVREVSPWAGAGPILAWAMVHAALDGLDPALTAGSSAESELGAHAQQVARRREAARVALERGAARRATLDAWRIEALRRSLLVHPAIAQAWAVDLTTASTTITGLVLRLDPDCLPRTGLDEGQIVRQIDGVMSLISPPGCDWCVRISYTTEGLPPELATLTQSLAPLKT